MSLTEDVFLPQILATSAYDLLFLSLLSQQLSPLHFKKALYGFSVA